MGRGEIFQRILLPYDGAICLRLLRVARELLAKNTHRSDIATLKSCKKWRIDVIAIFPRNTKRRCHTCSQSAQVFSDMPGAFTA